MSNSVEVWQTFRDAYSKFEAARIDGASEADILTRIVVPITRPVILPAMLVTFIGPRNEFLWPFLITRRLDLEPLAVAPVHPVRAWLRDKGLVFT